MHGRHKLGASQVCARQLPRKVTEKILDKLGISLGDDLTDVLDYLEITYLLRLSDSGRAHLRAVSMKFYGRFWQLIVSLIYAVTLDYAVTQPDSPQCATRLTPIPAGYKLFFCRCAELGKIVLLPSLQILPESKTLTAAIVNF